MRKLKSIVCSSYPFSALSTFFRTPLIVNSTKLHQFGFFVPALVALAFYFNLNMFELYPRVGWVDAGMYVGYVNNDNLIKDYKLNIHGYQGSRLGYILPAKFFSTIFNPVLGRYLFVFSYYLTGLMALFVFVRRVVKRTDLQSLFMTVIICNPLLLAGLSYGGADGPAAIYIILSSVFLYLSVYSKYLISVCLILAGFFAALSISTHILTCIPLAIIFFTYLILQRIKYKNILIVGAIFFITIFSLSIVGYYLGLEKNYLLYSYDWSVKSVNKIGGLYNQPMSEKIFHLFIYIPPLFMSALAFFYLIKGNLTNQILRFSFIPELLDRSGFIKQNNIVRSKAGLLKSMDSDYQENNISISHANDRDTLIRRYFVLVSVLLSLTPLLFFLFFDTVLGGTLSQYLSYYQLIFPCFIFSFIFLIGNGINKFTKETTFITNILLSSLFISTVLSIKIYYLIVLEIILVFIVCVCLKNFPKNTKKLNISYLIILLLSAQYFCFAYNKNIIPFYKKSSNANSDELFISELKFMSAIKNIPRSYGLPIFIYDSIIKKDKLMPGQFYQLYFNGEKRVFSYFDSLTALYLWDRSILIDNLRAENFESVILNSDTSKCIVMLGRNMVEVNHIYKRASSILSNIKPVSSECFMSNSYPWCIKVIKKYS